MRITVVPDRCASLYCDKVMGVQVYSPVLYFAASSNGLSASWLKESETSCWCRPLGPIGSFRAFRSFWATSLR